MLRGGATSESQLGDQGSKSPQTARACNAQTDPSKWYRLAFLALGPREEAGPPAPGEPPPLPTRLSTCLTGARRRLPLAHCGLPGGSVPNQPVRGRGGLLLRAAVDPHLPAGARDPQVFDSPIRPLRPQSGTGAGRPEPSQRHSSTALCGALRPALLGSHGSDVPQGHVAPAPLSYSLSRRALRVLRS